MNKARLLLLISIIFFSFDQIKAQGISTAEKVSKRNANQLLRFDNQILKSSDFSAQLYTQLGLQSEEDLQLRKRIKGQNGWTRYRMQQSYKGLRVVGAAYILHEKDNQVRKSSGELLPYIGLDVKPGINQGTAKEKVRKYTNSILLSKTEGAAVVLPDWDMEQAELVIMDKAYPAFSGNYTLAYHVIISNLRGANQYRESVYVDAHTGSILEAISEIAHTSVEGIALTKYYGEQKIITDSIAPDLYYLRDSTRGGGIITHNGSLDNFEDEDNFWDNFGNKEEVGTDAHYCASSYYDYMLSAFDWDGLDGEGFELRSRVYGDERNVVNATWNGSYSTFFSGDCDEYGPLTTMDVVGHEFAHGFTDFTSDLIYRNESGALNESISDIFGKALEFTYDAANKDWLIGSKFLLTDEDNHFRDMSNPNNKNHPKLYAGEHWEFGIRDNGGVHINSGVLNFWFYLLSEGEAGVNELEVDYDVSAIGYQKAAAIVFTMNTAYLTESSTYTKAVAASIESVKDLYGENTQEMISVLEAWKAVGLYPDSGNYDLRIELVEDRPYLCADELDNFIVDVMVHNDGLQSYQSGDELTLSYEIEDELITSNLVILTEDLLPGDTLFYTFPQSPANLESGGNFDILVLLEAEASLDPNSANGEIIMTNNTDDGRLTTTSQPGLDVRMSSITLTARTACQVSDDSQVRVSIQNTGCTEIPEGDYPLSIIAAGSEYVFEVTLPFDLRAGSFATIFDYIVLPNEIANGDSFEAVLNVTNDVDAENNSGEGQFLFLETVSEGYEEPFNSFDVLTNVEIFIDPDFRSDARIGDVNGNNMLVISGTSNTPFNLENCVDQEAFFRENYQKTDIEMCVNVVGVEDPTLSFDLIQYRAEMALENIDPSYSVMVKVSIDEDYEINYPIIAGQPNGELVRNDFALPADFSDEVLIEVITLRGEGAVFFPGNVANNDFALIDNIRITAGPLSTETIEDENEWHVYPNPSSSVFNFVNTSSKAYELVIYDGLGRLVYQVVEEGAFTSWDASKHEGGIYFYDLIYKNGQKEQGKLVVTR